MVVVLMMAVGRWVVAPIRVTADSMSPTITADSVAVVDKLSDAWRAPRRGDIVIVDDSVAGSEVVKRIVALGGEVVELTDGELWVDGRRIDEPYAVAESSAGIFFGPTTVPNGSVFVLGDHRRASVDSRAFGPVPIDDLVGRVIWPT